MTTPRITLPQAEDQANNLRAYLNSIGLDLTTSKARNAIAHQHDFKDWEELADALEDQVYLFFVEGFVDLDEQIADYSVDVNTLVEATTPELAIYHTKKLIESKIHLLPKMCRVNFQSVHRLPCITGKGSILSVSVFHDDASCISDTFPLEGDDEALYKYFDYPDQHLTLDHLRGKTQTSWNDLTGCAEPNLSLAALEARRNLQNKAEPKPEWKRPSPKEAVRIIAARKAHGIRTKRPPQDAIDKAMKKFKGNRKAVAEYLGSSVHVIQRTTKSDKPPVWERECENIMKALEKNDGNKAAAARDLKLTVRIVNRALEFIKAAEKECKQLVI